MEHHQVAEIVLMAPDAWDRTFTLREIVLRGQEVGKRTTGERLSDWTQRVGAGRTRMELVGAWDLDIPDPVGQGAFEIERTVDDLEELVDRFVELAWPRRSARSA
jgi:protein-tyrosine-phosphatase